MIRFTCPKCHDEIYFLWGDDITKHGRCRCLKCGTAYIFMAATEEDLLRKQFKRKEKENETEKG